MKKYAGLDVHGKETVFVIQDEQGEVVAEGRAPTSREGLAQIAAAGALAEGTAVGLETGTQCKWAARVLRELKLEPVVLDAAEVRAKARRIGQKTDRRDAWEICDGLRRDQYVKRVWIPPAAIDRLRELLSRRRHFVRERTRQINAAKFVLRGRGLARPKTLRTAAAWEALLGRSDLDESVREFLAMHFAVWRAAGEQIESLEQSLDKAIEPVEAIAKRLQTVPGVGPIVSASFIAALGDAARFEESGRVVSYLGLAPSMRDSGERERHGSITKQGSAWTRTVLIEAAHQARSARHPLHPYWIRLVARGGVKKAAVAIAGRLARILWRVWRDERDFDLEPLNVVFEPGTKSKTEYYRMKKSPKEAAA